MTEKEAKEKVMEAFNLLKEVCDDGKHDENFLFVWIEHPDGCGNGRHHKHDFHVRLSFRNAHHGMDCFSAGFNAWNELAHSK